MNKFFFFIKKRKKKSPRHKWTRQSGLGKSTNNDVTLTWGERCYCLLLAWDWESTIRVSQSPPSLLLLFGFGPFGWAEMRWDEMRWWGQIQSQSQSQRKPLFLLPPNILSSLSTTIPTKLCYFFNLSTLSLRSFFACCSLSLSGKCIAEVSFFSLGYLSVFFFLLSVELLNVICWV